MVGYANGFKLSRKELEGKFLDVSGMHFSGKRTVFSRKNLNNWTFA
tara:strand:- start:188 stop:325 length:138 start_codon:yes stop_codon:yes gene_type:complete